MSETTYYNVRTFVGGPGDGFTTTQDSTVLSYVNPLDPSDYGFYVREDDGTYRWLTREQYTEYRMNLR